MEVKTSGIVGAGVEGGPWRSPGRDRATPPTRRRDSSLSRGGCRRGVTGKETRNGGTLAPLQQKPDPAAAPRKSPECRRVMTAEEPVLWLEGAGRTEQRGASLSSCVSQPSPHCASPPPPGTNLATTFPREKRVELWRWTGWVSVLVEKGSFGSCGWGRIGDCQLGAPPTAPMPTTRRERPHCPGGGGGHENTDRVFTAVFPSLGTSSSVTR